VRDRFFTPFLRRWRIDWLDGIVGVFFLGLAARLALTGRPNG